MPSPTAILSVRVPVTALAKLLDVYEAQGISFESRSNFIRVVIEDLANGLEGREYTTEQAIERIAHLRDQPSNRARVGSTLAKVISSERHVGPSASVDEDIRAVIEAMTNKSPHGDKPE